MERITKRMPDGSLTADGADTKALISALAKFEDMYESIDVERDVLRLNMKALASRGMSRGVDYTTLMASDYMLMEMKNRMDETPEYTAGRLEALRKADAAPAPSPDDDGYRDVE